MSINEKFISKIFESMVEYKPKLALLMDEDDDFYDTRELSNSVCKLFPWPIGVELRRLLSGNMESLDRGRIDQIFRTIERTLQYISFILLIDLLEKTLDENLEVSDSFKKQFKSRFTTTTMGNFVWLIRSIISILNTASKKLFISEMENIFTKKFLNSLDFWTPERNEIGHYQINLPDEEIEVRCYEYLDKLGDILSKSAFLINYPLVTISEVRLIKPKRKTEMYNHSMMILNSASSTFQGKNIDFSEFTDTHSVLLVKSVKGATSDYLNLSPLIIDTHFEVMENREKLTKLKKDVYLYSKWNLKNNMLNYVGTEATEKPDMRLLSFYDQLVEEHQEILDLFTLQEE